MICLILGYGARAKPLLEKVLREEGIDGVVLTDESCAERLDEVRKAKVVFVYAHELPEGVVSAIRESGAKVVSAEDGLANVPPEVVVKARAYYILGGERNLRNLVRYLASLSGANVSYEEPEDVPMQGIYHPDYGLFLDTDEYLRVYRLRPLVGVLFWRSEWLYGDLGVTRGLIRALEEEGLGVVPVFTYGRDSVTGLGHDKAETVRRFLLRDGRPLVEALVSLVSFGIA
ncbi:TPA: cobalt chelatase, partial [Candidatus Micrarchaeota archaeon]|nr:cobalt chelatase [Candidatus Micrarchaeota archaeon]